MQKWLIRVESATNRPETFSGVTFDVQCMELICKLISYGPECSGMVLWSRQRDAAVRQQKRMAWCEPFAIYAPAHESVF